MEKNQERTEQLLVEQHVCFRRKPLQYSVVFSRSTVITTLGLLKPHAATAKTDWSHWVHLHQRVSYCGKGHYVNKAWLIFISAGADEEMMVITSTLNYPTCAGNYTDSMHKLDTAWHEHIVYAVICISNYHYFFNLALKLLVADTERLVSRKGNRPCFFWRCMFISEIPLFCWITNSLSTFSFLRTKVLISACAYFEKRRV